MAKTKTMNSLINANRTKLILGIIGIIAIGGIMFFSCTEEKKDFKNYNSKSNSNYSQQTNYVGKKHNQLCDFFNKNFSFVNNPDLKPISTKDFIEWTMASKSFFLQLGYTKNEIDKTIDGVLTFLNQFKDNPVTGESTLMEKLKTTNDIVLMACNTPDFSPKLKSYLLALNQLARDTNSLQSDVDKIIKQIETLPPSYEKALTLDVYYHSKEYWTNFNLCNSKDHNPGGMGDAEWQIICDTIGAIYGTSFGVFGSILVGGLMSWAVANSQRRMA